MRTFVYHVFATYTYKRDILCDSAWQKVGTDFNRSVQRLRRLHNSNIQYIRTIEAHEDDYPHIHVVYRFQQMLSVDYARYFDKKLYQLWKEKVWTSGHSDYVPPKNVTPIFYLLKYISKNTPTYKTLWKRYYQLNPTTSTSSVTVKSVKIPDYSPSESTFTNTTETKFQKTLFFCKKFNLKQLSWSRSFWRAGPTTVGATTSQLKI